MNKSDLKKRISSKLNHLTKKDVEEGSSLIIQHLTNSLYNENRIELRGFGSFSLRKRKERFSRNPKSGKSILIGSKSYLYFRPSKDLKDINN